MRYVYVLVILVFMGCNNGKKYHTANAVGEPTIQSHALNDILKFQQKMNEDFKDPEKSPLPDRHRKNFEGLDFFAPDTTYRIAAKFVRTPDAVPFMMPTTTDRKSKEVVYGIAHFSLHGKKHQLEVYQNKELMLEEGYEDYLFLPFLDHTNGETTYGGGRYLDLRIPENDTLIIDFNKAYNPYCVYNKKYSCPIVPRVNDIDAMVNAGIKAFDPETK